MKSKTKGTTLPVPVPPKGKKMPKMKGEAHEYDSNRPKNQVMSRYSK